ncbi:casein kinase II, regulatory subunit, partial [Caulochytrium protostelioides]
WVEWHSRLRGHEFFCEIDEDYILDRFNLTGLNLDVPHYAAAYDLINDCLEDTLDDATRVEVDRSARLLYGLIHARFILTQRGLAKMYEKYRLGHFGRCPRVLCGGQETLPVGLTDTPGMKSVKLFCPRCEDVYTPPARRHAAIDGAFFGTTFPHLLLNSMPEIMPRK